MENDARASERVLEENRLRLQEELAELRILLEQKEEMIEQKDEVIKKLEARLSKHEDTIADIARQPRIENTTKIIENTTNILSPITAEHLRDQARFLQMEHIQEGMDGYARYALDYPLRTDCLYGFLLKKDPV